MGRREREAVAPETMRSDRYQEEWLRLPGLFRRFEFARVIEVGREFFIEAAGQDDRGMALHRIYFRPQRPIPEGGNPRGGASLFAGGEA
ncbi:MAG: hypothetical protein HY901_23890 [Deltaproteobacteria bacterium]|nr:hypothetical protein [Deltaproteobacteria bacterium]